MRARSYQMCVYRMYKGHQESATWTCTSEGGTTAEAIFHPFSHAFACVCVWIPQRLTAAPAAHHSARSAALSRKEAKGKGICKFTGAEMTAMQWRVLLVWDLSGWKIPGLLFYIFYFFQSTDWSVFGKQTTQTPALQPEGPQKPSTAFRFSCF